MSVHISYLLNMLLEWNSLEIQTSRQISFCVCGFQKSQDGGTHELLNGPKAKPNDIARCLSTLALMNMQDIASADTNNDFVDDYFITRPMDNDERDSDLSQTQLTMTYSLFVKELATSCVLIIVTMYISANKHL